MTTICPNCLHPVRTSANYCGFCGNSLIAAAKPEPVPKLSSPPIEMEQGSAGSSDISPKARRMTTGRIVMIVVVIILCLIIIAALGLNYWYTLHPQTGQIPTLLYLRLLFHYFG